MNWFQKLFGIKKTGRNQVEFEPDSNNIYFHEDSYCQVELLPIENLQELESENEKIKEFVKEHFDGWGYTDIYCRDGQGIETAERKIDVKDSESLILCFDFIKAKHISTGYSNYKEECKNTNAYSVDGAVIFCDYDLGIIKNIWLDGFRFQSESEHVKEMVEVLFQIGEKWRLTLNDWDLTENIDLKDRSEIEKYIKEK